MLLYAGQASLYIIEHGFMYFLWEEEVSRYFFYHQ